MKIPFIKIFLILMFTFVLISNILNFVAIGTNQWIQTSSNIIRYLWAALQGNNASSLSIRVYALIATGTTLNIISLLLATASLLSLFVRKIKDKFALYFVFGCLVTSLLALLFNSTGWYSVMDDNIEQTNYTSIKFLFSFWLMTPVFACNVLGSVFASIIIGHTVTFNKFMLLGKINF
jgi:hypothetical protein